MCDTKTIYLFRATVILHLLLCSTLLYILRLVDNKYLQFSL